MRRLAGLLLALLASAGTWAQGDAPTAGVRLYREGILSSGAPLQGVRGDLKMEGADAACVNCHRRSGLGMKEGLSSIPPISGLYLFHPRATSADEQDLPFVDGMRADRDPYTDETLALAIREGVGADGKPLSYLMPRYALDDGDMASLITYLKSLTGGPVPGVGTELLQFATVITPDADPVQRAGMLDVLNEFFADKNQFIRAESPRLRSSRRMMFKTNRHWQLHVWELKGPPDTWEQQLQQWQKREPVFALLSGLSGRTWEPVHRFCEHAAIPCLFPNVALPVVAERDFYSLYFSKGVLLEAQLLAHRLRESAGGAARRIVQVYRVGDVGETAAKALGAAYGGADHSIVNLPLSATATPRELSKALRSVGRGDALVLWLRPKDVAQLAGEPVRSASVFMSALLGGADQMPLPAAWRRVTELAYPFDLPQRRRVRVDYALSWMRLRHVSLVSEQVQTDTYLACSLVSETLNQMSDSFIREYLVERIEEMLEHRIITGYYPRLGLAPNQRFASKGGYIVKFDDASGSRLTAVGDWTVP